MQILEKVVNRDSSESRVRFNRLINLLNEGMSSIRGGYAASRFVVEI